MKMHRLGYALSFSLPFTLLAGWALGGAGTFLTVAAVFGVLPLLDAAVGTTEVRALDTASRSWRHWFDGLLYAWIPMQFAVLVWGAWAYAHAGSTLEATGIAVSVGVITGGVGITVAHELGHRLPLRDRLWSCVLLGSVAYAHFHIEHNQGHHARVATPDDPATARAGETLYGFVVRSVVDGFASAWSLEARRLRRLGHAVAGVRNRMIWTTLAPVAMAAGLAAAFGSSAVAYFVVQATVAVTLLEAVNYVEHYGLRRARGADGRYERVRPAHSWNSSHRLSNWFLFNLQRHSHHHAHVTRHYEELAHCEDAPQLPVGYPAAILLSLLPPLWRRVMDARLAKWLPSAPVTP